MLDTVLDSVLTSIRNKLHSKIESPRNTMFSRRYDTSDVKQETLIQIWQEAELQGVENVPLTNAWLRTVCHGHQAKIKKFHAAQKRSVKQEQTPPDHCSRQDDPVANAEQREQTSRVLLAMDTLDDEQRLILKYRIVEQMSFAGIANMMSLPEHTVKRQYQRILKKLKQHLS